MRVNKCDICGATGDEATLIKMRSKNPLYINTYDTCVSFSCPEFCEFYICKNCKNCLDNSKDLQVFLAREIKSNDQ